MIRRLVLYPTLLAAFPVLSLYQHNARETHFDVLTAPLILVALTVPALWGLLALALKDGHRAGLVTTLLVALFGTAGVATEAAESALAALGLMERTGAGLFPFDVVAVEALVVAILIGLAIFAVKDARPWTFPLNVFGLILVALPLANAAVARLGGPREVARIRSALDVPLEAKAKPDIYYIILDAFGRGDVLRDLYDYDCEPFLQHLEDRGFVVARRSTSNYGQTRASLASSLNGSYLDDLAQAGAVNEDALHDLIRDSGLTRALRREGYEVVTFDSGYHLTDNLIADTRLQPVPHLDEFHRQLVAMTALRFGPGGLGPFDPQATGRRRVLGILEGLPEVARRPGPTFTFAHILSPHPPFLFGEHGEDVSHRGLDSMADGDYYQGDWPDGYIERYRAQVAFLAGKVAEAIDRILDESPEPPIIIVQGDHGPGSRLFQNDPGKTDVHERLSILNAYHLPGLDRDARPEGLADDVTPVNTFRILFRTYFAAELDLLDDRCYLTSWDSPYDFRDVTAQARPQAGEARAVRTAEPR